MPVRAHALDEPSGHQLPRLLGKSAHEAGRAEQRDAAEARAAGVSRRTMTRLFDNDVGMSFDRWRTHVRLRAALPMLAEGQPVSRVAHAVGYATPSAFLAAFRRTVGTSPSRYLGADAR
jgi:AraC-like DNA-binding protein